MADPVGAGISPSTLQFVIAAFRTGLGGNLDLTSTTNRRKMATDEDQHGYGKRAVRNGDGTSMTIAQIATAANLTTAQVIDIAGRI